MFNKSLIENFTRLQTPFYYYDVSLLHKTLKGLKKVVEKYDYIVHYAVKANSNDRILNIINSYGFGADCVSGNEIIKSLKTGFDKKTIVFAGVGKSDDEIKTALKNEIFCFNIESLQELEVINSFARSMNKKAKIAIRVNPNVNAKTHNYITTGLEENKFGINPWEFDTIINKIKDLKSLNLIGLHFHIGSQIMDLNVFKGLCIRVNEVRRWFNDHQITFEHLNVGGGLGVNYEEPEEEVVPDFKSYFNLFNRLLDLGRGQSLHFELGRAIVAHCGSLISKVLYVKKGINTKFIILDAGMTELIRPALYQAYHKIENLTSNRKIEKYDVVGPVCETSDTFGKAITLPGTERGDILAVRTVGAYGEVMSSGYNMRTAAPHFYSDDIPIQQAQ